MKNSLFKKNFIILLVCFVPLCCDRSRNEIKSKFKSPASKLVESFFKNWKLKRYKQMHAQTIYSRDSDIFEERLKNTPIQWKNLVILDEKKVDNDWYIELKLDVTAPVSALAACIINSRYSSNKDLGEGKFIYTPHLLGIEKFITVKQIWHIENVGDEYFIDVGAFESKIKRHENILNYFLDAGIVDFPPLGGSGKKGHSLDVISSWMAMVTMNLKLDNKECIEIIKGSKPLVEMAEKKMKKLIKLINETSFSNKKSNRQKDQIEGDEINGNIKTKFIPILFEMYEKHLLFFHNKDSLEKNAGPLSPTKRKEILKWLTEINFENIPLYVKYDFEECRLAFVKLLDNPPSNGFTLGYKKGELTQKFMPIFVDFEIDKKIIRQYEEGELAKRLEGVLDFGKEILLTGSGIKLKKSMDIKPLTKFFIEYLIIWANMFESKERPVLTQLALLAMQPNDFKNPIERKIFTDLHNDLLDISKYISEKGKTYRNPSNKEVGASINDPFFMKISKPISGFLKIISQFNISDEEIKTVGGISLLQTVHKMKELLN